MQALEEKFPDAETDRADGLKLLLGGEWVHVRASNTEPVMRIAAEAGTQEEVDKLYAVVSELLTG
jgi:phosphomannomutase